MFVQVWWPIILVVFAGLYAWLGAFIVTRDGQNLRSRLAAAAFVLLALWYFSTAMMIDRQESEFGRTFWFRVALLVTLPATVLWFQAALMLMLDVHQPKRRTLWARLGWVVVVLGVALAAANSLSRLALGAEPIPPMEAFGACRYYCVGLGNPLLMSLGYFLDVANLTTSILFTLSYLRARRHQLPGQSGLLWLTVAGYLFLVARLSVYGVRVGALQSQVPALLSVISGLMIGWGIGKYNALVKQRVLERDILLAFIEFCQIVVGYIALPLLGVQALRPRGIVGGGLDVFQLGVVTLLAVLTYSTITQVRRRIDLTVSADPAARLRSSVTALIEDSGQGAPLTATMQALELAAPRALINEYVDKQLLRKLDAPDSLEYLANCPLQNLAYVLHTLTDAYRTTGTLASDNERAGAILHLLREAAHRIKLKAEQGGGRQLNVAEVLWLRLEKGLDRAAITQQLNIHVRTYDRLLDEGVAQLADAVFELEKQQRSAASQSSRFVIPDQSLIHAERRAGLSA